MIDLQSKSVADSLFCAKTGRFYTFQTFALTLIVNSVELASS